VAQRRELRRGGVPARGGTALRDTKNRALAAHHYPAATWTAFLAAVRSGEFTTR
jgi:hypothetical protein